MVRTGFGYDIHCFAANRKLILGGVTIPSEKGLVGHSDADVLLHAICDALLGAAALGDIGQHFPDTDRKFEGVSSLTFLANVNDLLTRNEFKVVNVDSTVVLQHPKIARWIPEMQNNIARALQVSPLDVSVKATTSEGLGAIGSGAGCAAYAVAAIRSLKRDP